MRGRDKITPLQAEAIMAAFDMVHARHEALPFAHVSQVSEEHADRFANAFIKESLADAGMVAVERSGIIEIPHDSDPVRTPPDVEACLATCHRIAESTLKTARPMLAQAFRDAAGRELGIAPLPAERSADPKAFEHVEAITEDHGRKFADALFEHWSDNGTFFDALSDVEVMRWPTASDDECIPVRLTAPQAEFHTAENAIADLVEAELRDAIAHAFRRAASRVLGVPIEEAAR